MGLEAAPPLIGQVSSGSQLLNQLWPDDPELSWSFRERSCLVLQGGVLYQKLAGEDGENVQFVLPDSMKDCGHLGQDKTVELICQQFCWPGMGKEAHSKLREVHKLQILSLT